MNVCSKVVFKNYYSSSKHFAPPVIPVDSANWHESAITFESNLNQKLQSVIRSKDVRIKMLQKNENALIEKLEKLELRWAALQANQEKLKFENNAFRSIGWANSPEEYVNGINEFQAKHESTWSDWQIEIGIRALQYYQTQSKFFNDHIQKSRTKKEIEVKVKEMSVQANHAAQRVVRAESKEFKEFDKFIKDVMKGTKCNKKTALMNAKLMGMVAPADYDIS